MMKKIFAVLLVTAICTLELAADCVDLGTCNSVAAFIQKKYCD